MSNLRKGVYYIQSRDQLVVLSKVQIYEDAKSKFAIVTWRESEKRDYPRTLIKGKSFKHFKRIGEL